MSREETLAMLADFEDELDALMRSWGEVVLPPEVQDAVSTVFAKIDELREGL